MNLHKKILAGLFAISTLVPLPLLTVAYAQAPASQVAAPVIAGFDVEQLKRLSAGDDLVFTLYGTPGGTARIKIDGTIGERLLEEVEPGVYEATYTIRGRDSLSATTLVTANLRLGNQVATALLDESLLAGALSPARAAANLIPKIDRFSVEPSPKLTSGSDLYFTLNGTPGGKASVRMTGVKGKIALDEVSSGKYEGGYTIKERDRVASNAVVTSSLAIGTRTDTKILNQPLIASNATPARNRAAPVCANCGTVETINVIEVNGDGTYLGKIAGGVAGALIGSQIGKGNGTTAAEILGAVGGAYAGNEIEKRVKKTTHYEVVTRLNSGGTQTITYPTVPPFKVGDKVRIESNSLVLIQ